MSTRSTTMSLIAAAQLLGAFTTSVLASGGPVAVSGGLEDVVPAWFIDLGDEALCSPNDIGGARLDGSGQMSAPVGSFTFTLTGAWDWDATAPGVYTATAVLPDDSGVVLGAAGYPHGFCSEPRVATGVVTLSTANGTISGAITGGEVYAGDVIPPESNDGSGEDGAGGVAAVVVAFRGEELFLEVTITGGTGDFAGAGGALLIHTTLARVNDEFKVYTAEIGGTLELPGACCLLDGSCAPLDPVDCGAAGGVHQGDGSTCATVMCPQPATGGCCLVDAIGEVDCSVLTEADCAVTGGLYQGDESGCAASLCAAQLLGSCCLLDGSCDDDVTSARCALDGGLFAGVGAGCPPAGCPAPGWLGAAPLPSSSFSGHTTALLPDGRVLLVGGADGAVAGAGGGGANAIIYDTARNTWHTAAPTGGRSGHTATVLPSGRVLLVGGDELGSAELYDARLDTWLPAGAPLAVHVAHTATRLRDGRVLVVGRAEEPLMAGAAHAELYDHTAGPAGGWTEAAGPLAARRHHTSTLLADGRVLIAGGVDGAGSTLDTAELYDPLTDTWSPAAALGAARRDHTAVLLPDGRVLAAGGIDALLGSAIATAEIYDPSSDTWSPAAPLDHARARHSATLLPMGAVMIAGGADDLGAVAAVELYNVAANTWTTVSALGDARSGHTATILANGRVLLAGGVDGAGAPVNATELFELIDDRWTAAAAMNTARDGHSVTPLADGRVLVAGGGTGGGLVAMAELYDQTADDWTDAAALGAPRRDHAATLLADGRVLVCGGDGAGGALASAEIYDPGAGTWSAVAAPMNSARRGHSATVLASGRVLATGGRDAGDDPLATAELLDPATGDWSALPPLSRPRSGHSATLLEGGAVLIRGGDDAAPASCELFDPLLGTFVPAGAPLEQRAGHCAILLACGRLLVCGGERDGAPLDSAELYDPLSDEWLAAAPMHAARAEHSAALLPDGRVLVAGGSGAMSAEIYDPALDAWKPLDGLAGVDGAVALAALPDGRALLTSVDPVALGGASSAAIYETGLGFQEPWRPLLGAVSSPLLTSDAAVLAGVRFTGISEASGGNGGQHAPSSHPLVQVRSMLNGQTRWMHADPGSGWSPETYTALPPGGFPPGPALATMFVNGIPSAPAMLMIADDPPAIACPGAITIASCGEAAPDLTAHAQFSVADNGTVVAVVQSPAAGAPLAGATTIDITAIDDSGLTATCSVDVLLDDTTDPVFTVQPTDAVIACGDETAPAATGTAAATDDCAAPQVSFADDVEPGCGASRVITRTWTAVDAAGNAASFEQLITVVDETAPSFQSVPANTTVQCGADTAPVSTGAPSALDLCGAVTFAHTDSVEPGCGGSRVITRTWTATDACGNAAQAQQTITVIDTSSPTFQSFPAGAIVACGGDSSPTATGVPAATDGCSSVTITSADVFTAGCGSAGTITRTWTATDACGNSIAQAQTITLVDDVDPWFTSFPSDTSVECGASIDPAATGTPAGDDGCGAVTLSYADTGPAGPGEGEITRTWTLTDACGNSVAQAQTITLTDEGFPVYDSFPSDITVECGEATDPSATGEPAASDACGPVTITFADMPVGGCGSTQIIARFWTAADASGNQHVRDQIITVADTTGPTFESFPADATVECGDATAPAATGTPIAADACGSAEVSFADAAVPGCATTDSIVRTWTATDACGNTTVREQVITVADTAPPGFTSVPGAATVECGDETAPAVLGEATAADSCGSVEVSFADAAAPGCGGAATIVRTWTATDACGNSASVEQVITVADTTAPTIDSFPADVNVECGGDIAPAATGAPTGSDSCGTVSASFADAAAPGCGGAETIIRTWTLSDDCGNTASRDQIITLADSTAPTFTIFPADVTLECGAPTAPGATGQPAAEDACGAVELSHADAVVPGCGAATVIMRTWTATDGCGNATSADQAITLADTTAPTFESFPSDALIACGDDASPASTGTPGAADGCGGTVTIGHSDAAAGGCGGTSVIVRTWTITDACGNSTSQAQVITRQDITPPVFTSIPGDTAIECGADTSPASTGQPAGSDVCSSATITFADAFTASCGSAGTIARTWTIADECGNTADAVQLIELLDTTPPVITCPSSTSAECPAETGIGSRGAATAEDSCGEVTLTHADELDASCGGAGTVLRTWTATDACGNTATCMQTITTDDTTPPVLAAPADLEVTMPAGTPGCAVAVDPGEPEVSDGCDDGPVVQAMRDDGLTLGDPFAAGTTVIIWSATDACGNSADAVQLVVVTPVIYVDPAAPAGGDGASWATAMRNLRDALAQAAGGAGCPQEIWVAEGVQRPTSSTDRNASFGLLDDVAIYGGFPAGGGDGTRDARDPALFQTILSGDIGIAGNPLDNSYHVVSAGGRGPTAVLDGVVVEGGRATGQAPFGGGIWVLTSGSPTLRNLLVRNNHAGQKGGGLWGQSAGTPLIERCVFTGNTAGSLGAGASCEFGFSPTFLAVRFTGNGVAPGNGGALAMSSAAPQLVSCQIDGNSATLGAGIYCTSASSPLIVNGTLHGNLGAALHVSAGCTATVANTIVWGNTSSFVGPGTVIVTDSNVQGGWPGDGNIAADPLLVDNGAGVLRLLEGSPCIDTGDNDALPPGLDAFDLEGLPRIVDGNDDATATVDMGASEHSAPVDCNDNGVPDDDDIADETSADCDANGVPDECDIAGGAADCNANGVPDACDIADGTSIDENGNTIPDECEAPQCPADVDGSGMIDVDDLVAVILDWGTDGSANNADIDGSGMVDVDDLVAVILGWGVCEG